MRKMDLSILGTLIVFMWYCIISRRGRVCSTVGHYFEKRLHCTMRFHAVCSVFSGQVQIGEGAFVILWRYEQNQA
jgi:hypothetical protein